MQCPYCQNEDTKIIDSRSMEHKKRRRRECGRCGRRFTTFEIIERPMITVRKKDGTFEPFDRNKLMRGIFIAIKKRPVDIAQVEGIAEEVENHFASAMTNQVSSEEIGNMTLEMLKNVDDVAYIRFASVYKAFTSVEEFVKEISELNEGLKYK